MCREMDFQEEKGRSSRTVERRIFLLESVSSEEGDTCVCSWCRRLSMGCSRLNLRRAALIEEEVDEEEEGIDVFVLSLSLSVMERVEEVEYDVSILEVDKML